MTRLMITNAEKGEIRVSNARLQLLVTWLHFLNFVTVAVICLLFLKLYKGLLHLFKWFWPPRPEYDSPVILVMGPKNELVDEIVRQLSRTFNSEIIDCQDVNDNSFRELAPQKNPKQSQIICSHAPVASQDAVAELAKYVEKSFGDVDILVISQNEDPGESHHPQSFINHLNTRLLVQFWTVMAFLPGMLRRNNGRVISVALGGSSSANTGNKCVWLPVIPRMQCGGDPERKSRVMVLQLRAACLTGIMRTLQEEILQWDTKVKLTLVESESALQNFLPSLPNEILAKLIVRSIWSSGSVVKVPSLSCYPLVLPLLVVRYLMKPMLNVIALVRNS